MLALYHLQFCAINSQIRRHAVSGTSARTAITIVKEVCRLSHLLSEHVIYSNIT
jgi:hypothetical protein